jgi:hypothetical protein
VLLPLGDLGLGRGGAISQSTHLLTAALLLYSAVSEGLRHRQIEPEVIKRSLELLVVHCHEVRECEHGASFLYSRSRRSLRSHER